MGEGVAGEFAKDMRTLSYLQWTTNKNLPYSTRNSGREGSLEDNGHMYVCMAKSLCCSPETIKTLFINQLYFNAK